MPTIIGPLILADKGSIKSQVIYMQHIAHKTTNRKPQCKSPRQGNTENQGRDANNNIRSAKARSNSPLAVAQQV
jgi:hypothetical protein